MTFDKEKETPRELCDQTKLGKHEKLLTHDVGIKPAYQDLSLNQLYDLIEVAEARRDSSSPH